MEATTNIEEKCSLILLKSRMIMKNYVLFIVIVVVSFTSCKKEESNKEGYSFVFLPRKVKMVFISPGTKIFYEGSKDLNNYATLFENSVPEDQFFISILTSNYDPRPDLAKDNPNYDPKSSMPIGYPYSFDNLDDPIPSVEQQIKLDFEKDVKQNSSGNGSANNSEHIIFLEYRTSQIKALTVSTLNTPLFGRQAGESLNDFFDIVLYDPAVIISAPTERLVCGFSILNHNNPPGKEFPTSIDEWLNFRPFGQASMYLSPNKKMEGLPLNVQFVVQMETAEGLVLSDTTRTITITE